MLQGAPQSSSALCCVVRALHTVSKANAELSCLNLLPQAEHLQVLLSAPSVRPTAMCLFRERDADWLCLIQICKVLMPNVSQRELQRYTLRCEKSLFSVLLSTLHMPWRRPETAMSMMVDSNQLMLSGYYEALQFQLVNIYRSS